MQIPYRIPRFRNHLLLDPHVVIIGAGASKAACPIDKNGEKIPLLRDLSRIILSKNEISEYKLSENEMDDFEAFYTRLVSESKNDSFRLELEERIMEHFCKFEIPDSLTYYDYLVLSLTSKDAIISFNWDPFLIQTYLRNIKVGKLPELIFLHGCVGVGICDDCLVKGYNGYLCPKCKQRFQTMPLLYPLKEKNYDKIPIIKAEWELAKSYLSRAAGLTIFGYGAPTSDLEALNLLKKHIKKSNMIEIAPLTIINLDNVKVEQIEKWKEIISDRMFSYVDNFKKSILWESPRVSLECLFDAILQQHPREKLNPYEEFNTLEELQEFVMKINDFEMYV